MSKSWLYKQKNYRNSTWNELQRFIAFTVIPFIVCAIIASGIILVLFVPLVYLTK